MVHGGQGIPRDILEKLEFQLLWVPFQNEIHRLFISTSISYSLQYYILLDYNGQQALGTFKIEFATRFHFTPIPSTMENIL